MGRHSISMTGRHSLRLGQNGMFHPWKWTWGTSCLNANVKIDTFEVFCHKCLQFTVQSPQPIFLGSTKILSVKAWVLIWEALEMAVRVDYSTLLQTFLGSVWYWVIVGQLTGVKIRFLARMHFFLRPTLGLPPSLLTEIRMNNTSLS